MSEHEEKLREALEQLKTECNQRYEIFGAGEPKADTYLIGAAYAWCAQEIERALVAHPAQQPAPAGFDARGLANRIVAMLATKHKIYAGAGQAAPVALPAQALSEEQREELLRLAANCWDRDWDVEQQNVDVFIAFVNALLRQPAPVRAERNRTQHEAGDAHPMRQRAIALWDAIKDESDYERTLRQIETFLRMDAPASNTPSGSSTTSAPSREAMLEMRTSHTPLEDLAVPSTEPGIAERARELIIAAYDDIGESPNDELAHANIERYSQAVVDLLQRETARARLAVWEEAAKFAENHPARNPDKKHNQNCFTLIAGHFRARALAEAEGGKAS